MLVNELQVCGLREVVRTLDVLWTYVFFFALFWDMDALTAIFIVGFIKENKSRDFTTALH